MSQVNQLWYREPGSSPLREPIRTLARFSMESPATEFARENLDREGELISFLFLEMAEDGQTWIFAWVYIKSHNIPPKPPFHPSILLCLRPE